MANLAKAWVTRHAKGGLHNGIKMAVRGIPRVEVVSVREVPLTKAERRLQHIIEAVYKLPKGQGVRVKDSMDERYVDSSSMARSILSFARLLGKPVTTRVRFIDKDAYVYVFKRTDMTTRRNGLTTR